jgi:hypothetical protein
MVGSSDGTPHRTAADATTQGGRHTQGHPRDEGMVAGGRRSGGNASERAAREDLGEDGPDRWAPSVGNGVFVTDWQAGSRAKMGRGQCRAGPAAEKMDHTDFFHFKSFSN